MQGKLKSAAMDHSATPTYSISREQGKSGVLGIYSKDVCAGSWNLASLDLACRTEIFARGGGLLRPSSDSALGCLQCCALQARAPVLDMTPMLLRCRSLLQRSPEYYEYIDSAMPETFSRVIVGADWARWDLCVTHVQC